MELFSQVEQQDVPFEGLKIQFLYLNVQEFNANSAIRNWVQLGVFSRFFTWALDQSAIHRFPVDIRWFGHCLALYFGGEWQDTYFFDTFHGLSGI